MAIFAQEPVTTRNATCCCGTKDHARMPERRSDPSVRHRSRLGQPLLQVVGVEAHVVAETMMRYLLRTGLRQQPRVRHTEKLAGGLRVDRRRERRVCHATSAVPAAGSGPTRRRWTGYGGMRLRLRMENPPIVCQRSSYLGRARPAGVSAQQRRRRDTSRRPTSIHGQTARDDPPFTYRGAGATSAATADGASSAQGTHAP
jgi:hypothetical protein